MTTALFPADLLVQADGQRIYTTSLKLAEHFKRNHKDVLRAIRNILEATTDEVSRRNFAPRDYVDERGKTQPIYELTHDGFAIAVMGFTGPEALAWKWKFLAAFRALEADLQAALEREATWYRHHAANLRAGWYERYPLWRDLLAASALGQTRAQMARETGRHPATIGRNLRRMRQVGLLTQDPRRRAAGTPTRVQS
jgi:Rha family phage regulatory protein